MTIYILAPAPYQTFSSMPSGSVYMSDANKMIFVINNSVPDQLALMGAGCLTLNTLLTQYPVGSATLAGLYTLDTTNSYPQGMVAQVFNDGGNTGTWIKTATGTGSGNWTQESTSTFASLQASINTNAGQISSEASRAQAAETTIATNLTIETARAEGAEAINARNIASVSSIITTLQAQLIAATFNTARFCSGGTPPGTVDAATTGALPTCIYEPQTGGDQLIGLSTSALPSQDGVSMSVGKRLLVRNQVAGLQDGIYALTQQGDGISLPWILTRASDAYQASQLGGIECAVLGGMTLAGTTWLLPIAASSIIVGTTALAFVQLATPGQIVPGGPERWDTLLNGTFSLNASNKNVAADSTSGAVNLTLPSTHQSIFVKDEGGAASPSNPINVFPDGGNTIEGGAGPFVMNVARQGFTFKFDTTKNNWSVS